MNTRQKLIVFVVALIVIIAGTSWLRSGGDGIKEGQVYELALTMQAKEKVADGQKSEQFQFFVFADRNLSQNSILVPLRNEHNMPLTQEDTSLPASTAKQVRVRVPARTFEGASYPAYEYVQWRYHMTHVEPQRHIPAFIPAR